MTTEASFAGSAPLQEAMRRSLPLLNALTDEQANLRPGGGPGWTRKQELGHLLDSATNNRVRFVNAALQGHYTGPGYSADGWVELGGYAAMPWADVLQIWKDANHFLTVVIDRIPASRLPSQCAIGDGAPVTLQFLVEDYVVHLQHHLDHLLQFP